MDLSVERTGLDSLEGRNPFQSAFWAEEKRHNGWSGQAFSVKAGGHSWTVLVLVRDFHHLFSIAYIPFGFSRDLDSSLLVSFAREVRRYLPKNVILLRTDVAWGCQLNGGVDLHFNRFSVQPTGTVRIDLEKDLDFRDRVRRNLKKEDAVVIRLWDGNSEDFHKWYQTYVHTALRDHFSTRSEEYIRSLFDIRDPHVRPLLYLAYSDGEISGGILNLRTEEEEVYLFGSSVKHTGNTSCGYSLQSHAIIEAKKAGVRIYDMFGIEGEGEENSHIESLTVFKTAFGGEKVYRSPTVDFFYRPLTAYLFRLVDSFRYSNARRSRL